MAELRLHHYLAYIRERTNSSNASLPKEWHHSCEMRDVEKSDPLNYYKLVDELFKYFVEKCSNNVPKIPFFRGSVLAFDLEVNEKSTVFWDLIIYRCKYSMDYFDRGFHLAFRRYTKVIEELVLDCFDLITHQLKPDCNICFQFIQTLAKVMKSYEMKFKTHCPIVNDSDVLISDLKPLLFCNKMNFMVVNLDDEQDKESYLRYILITQNLVTLMNQTSKRSKISISYIISGNTISVFSGTRVSPFLIFDFHRTFNLENLTDLFDLALEFFNYLGYAHYGTEKECCFSFIPGIYESRKIEDNYGKPLKRETTENLDKFMREHAIKKKKDNEVIDNLRRNLKKLQIKT